MPGLVEISTASLSRTTGRRAAVGRRTRFPPGWCWQAPRSGSRPTVSGSLNVSAGSSQGQQRDQSDVRQRLASGAQHHHSTEVVTPEDPDVVGC
jgi:hypothetical protein